MQYEIPDTVAIRFAGTFYNELLTGIMLLQEKIKQDTIADGGWKRRDVEPQFHRYLPDGDPIRRELTR